jgi:hypothetical protein
VHIRHDYHQPKLVQMPLDTLLIVVALACAPQIRAQAVSVNPAKMPPIASIDQRFASYNIEMAEVTGELSGSLTAQARRPHKQSRQANQLPLPPG